jgi:hypothetical protein
MKSMAGDIFIIGRRKCLRLLKNQAWKSEQQAMVGLFSLTLKQYQNGVKENFKIQGQGSIFNI